MRAAIFVLIAAIVMYCPTTKSLRRTFMFAWVRRASTLHSSSKTIPSSPELTKTPEIPSNMRAFLNTRAKWALETWECSVTNEVAIAEKREELAKVLIQTLVEDVQEECSVLVEQTSHSTFLRRLSKRGLKSFKQLRAVGGDLTELEIGGVKFLKEMLHNIAQDAASSSRVFNTLASHHASMIGKDKYAQVIADRNKLATYSMAASEMGTKDWVISLNEWVANFTVTFFMKGGARRAYLKQIERQNINRRNAAKSTAALEALFKRLPKDVIPPGKKIKVLDVGSCYNPLSRSVLREHFEVTAVDLFPANSSVHQADFLNISVGPKGSNFIYNDEENSIKQLPADYFDACVMSLVLSYLPSPDMRKKMIEKARMLLREPPIEDPLSPYASLLVIGEKESIFKSSTCELRDHLPLLSAWKGGIQKLGFDLVKYRKVLNAKNSHVFAFRKVAGDEELIQEEKVNLGISQDFDPLGIKGMSLKSKRHIYKDAVPVAIVGGGIGGMALALALKSRGIPYMIFEKDENMSSRKQGYGLTLQQSGSALRALGIGRDELLRHGIPSSSHFSYTGSGELIGQYGKARNLADPSIQFVNRGEEICESIINKSYPVTTSGRHNIHIARQRLRELLFEKLDPSTISWKKHLISFDESSYSDLISLYFSDGTSQMARVVVAADGIYSLLRSKKASSSDKLQYLGVVVILGISDGLIVESFTKDRVQVQWLDGETRVFCMPFDRHRTMWQLSFPVESESEASKISASSKSLRDKAITLCDNWPAPLSRLLHSTSVENVSGHPVYDRDVLESGSEITRTLFAIDEETKRKSKIVFIGDAAHPMVFPLSKKLRILKTSDLYYTSFLLYCSPHLKARGPIKLLLTLLCLPGHYIRVICLWKGDNLWTMPCCNTRRR